jgi:hypothetical protein
MSAVKLTLSQKETSTRDLHLHLFI